MNKSDLIYTVLADKFQLIITFPTFFKTDEELVS